MRTDLNFPEYFPENTYQTPDKVPGLLLDWLTLKSRWGFFLHYGKNFLRNRQLALHNDYDDVTWADCSYQIFRDIERVGGKFEIEGLEHIKASTEPVVFIANHMSTCETMVLPFMIVPYKPVTFVVKEELTRGYFGPIMRAVDPIAVGRKDPRKDMETVLNEGADKLAKGKSVIIFPQSTRQVPFVKKEFNSLGVKLAKKAGVKALPIALKTDFWGNSKILKAIGPLKRKATLHFKFGAPLEIVKTGKEQHQEIVRFIADNVRSWGGLVRD